MMIDNLTCSRKSYCKCVGRSAIDYLHVRVVNLRSQNRHMLQCFGKKQLKGKEREKGELTCAHHIITDLSVLQFARSARMVAIKVPTTICCNVDAGFQAGDVHV